MIYDFNSKNTVNAYVDKLVCFVLSIHNIYKGKKIYTTTGLKAKLRKETLARFYLRPAPSVVTVE